MSRHLLTKALRTLAVLMALVALGAAGFILTGDPAGPRWTVLDGVFMAVTTLATVGYGEVHPLSMVGRIFAMVYLFIGFGAFAIGLMQLAEIAIQSQFSQWLGRRRMHTALMHMRDHFIVCGFGRMGQTVCEHLAEAKLPFIAIDRTEAALKECQERGWPCIAGDATDDRTLLDAGVERAQGLATVLPSESDNLYVVLSTRLLSKRILIIARSSDEKGRAKLEKAGANRVVNIYAAGASKMAQLLSNPKVEEFLEVITSRGKELGLTEIQVTPEAPYAGQALAQTAFRKLGIIIVGIRRPGGELLLPPASTEMIQAGDCLIALGRAEAIAELVKKA
jgi:voltage-gated potassium channel